MFSTKDYSTDPRAQVAAFAAHIAQAALAAASQDRALDLLANDNYVHTFAARCRTLAILLLDVGEASAAEPKSDEPKPAAKKRGAK